MPSERRRAPYRLLMSAFHFNQNPEDMQEAELDEYENECRQIIELVFLDVRAREIYAMDEMGVAQTRPEFYIEVAAKLMEITHLYPRDAQRLIGKVLQLVEHNAVMRDRMRRRDKVQTTRRVELAEPLEVPT